MFVGLLTLMTFKRYQTRALAMILIFIAPAYMFLRAGGYWSGQQLQTMANLISTDREQSVAFRMINEDLLTQKALQRPFFGWGGWGRSLIYYTTLNTNTVVDGEWVNAMGLTGLTGVFSYSAILLLPPFLLLRRIRPEMWGTPAFSTAAALLVLNILYMIDSLPNAMVNPIYMLAVGGMSGLLARKRPAVVVERPRLRSQDARDVSGLLVPNQFTPVA
jgi:hypothetical protein